MNYVNLNKGLATAEAGNLVQGYGRTISEVIGRSFGEVKALAAELGNPAHLFFVESSEPVTGYAKTSYQHPQHKLAWTQPIRRP